ncbi:FMN-binding protein [Candidatus Endoriftia persephonae]|jgi:electron transport complex protein RnfG|uniref:Ion-translocating oxidoreductase complex subunit G n=2 Tax=Gammaproteobacteria TaxID=1236 RepID=G2FJK8_9GAMM|nr:FMN-binding protein [Candidatus Endoriftia persephone]EGW53014.1 electron transport complex protein RnfG [endosymbiont of Tevnia jerichonana (vent Tica)]USF89020.1 FMN-binding protein [Candidatus Endoriftia persephone]
MSLAEHELQQPATPTGRMIRTLGGIAMLSGALVVTTVHLTKPAIEENQRRAIEAAVFQVIPEAVSHRDFIVTNQGITPVSDKDPGSGTRIYAGFDAQGQLRGIAANAGAQGYANVIHLLYGYDPACQCIRGIKVLKLTETPGLGDKIITDASFVANFDQLDARLDPTGTALEHPIVTVKHGSKHNPWEIDAISGATISSKAVGKALNQSVGALLPQLTPHLDQIEPEPVTPPNRQVEE